MVIVWGWCWDGDNIEMRMMTDGDGIEIMRVLLIEFGMGIMLGWEG